MPKLTRRQFLLALAAGMGSLTASQMLAACGQNPATPEEISTLTSVPEVTRESQPAAVASSTATSIPGSTDAPVANSTSAPTLPPTETAGGPYLAVARGKDPEALTRRAVAALGGMERFVPQGSTVVVKPNICVGYHTYEYAATTNPWVVGAIVKMCLEAGAASVKVMDNPFGGPAPEAYAKSGIEEQVKAAGGEMVIMAGFKYVETEIAQARKLKKTKIYEDVLNADVLIDVPIIKHHSAAILTLGMKNLMGVIENRDTLHYKGLGACIAELTSRIPPTLTVIDAVRMLMANGPSGGNLDDVKQTDTVIASADVVAADSYAARLYGHKPANIQYIKQGVDLGLGRSDLENLKIEELAVN